MCIKNIIAFLLLTLLLASCCACETDSVAPPEASSDSTTTAPSETEPAPSTDAVSVTLPRPRETLYNFTTFVTLDNNADGVGKLFSDIYDRGRNLVIMSKDGRSLSYEIDQSFIGNGILGIWVLIPEYRADEDTELIFDTSLTPIKCGNAWDSSYRLVLHMDGNGETDSSQYNNPLSFYGSLKRESGAVGYAMKFNGKNTYITSSDPLPMVGSAGFRIDNAYSNAGYVKPTDWQYAQGLTCDGEYFYFVGHNDKENAGSSVHKIRMSDMTEVAVFERVGPMHGAEIDWNYESDTLFSCTGGNGREAAVWEMSKTDGRKLSEWSFGSVGYGGAALVTYLGGRDIILFTSTDDGARISFAHITLGDNGAYTVNREWEYTDTDLGVPQGLDTLSVSTDGSFTVYYLADAGSKVTADPHYLYKITLAPGEVLRVDARYHISIGEETEGLVLKKTEDGVDVYFGTNAEKIYRLSDKLDSLRETPIVSGRSENAFTVSFFVRVDSIDAKYPNIMGYGSTTNGQNRFAFHLFNENPGVIRFGTTLDDTWIKLDSLGPSIPVNDGLHHVAATYDGERMSIYIDGEINHSFPVTGSLTDLGGAFIIGADIEKNELAYFFNGIIDEVRLSSGVRSAAWIKAEAELAK